MKVAVVGASGGMGSFFVRYFLEKGDAVAGSDPRGHSRPAVPSGRGFAAFKTNAEAVEGADVVILAVPMDMTLKAAKEVAPRLKSGSTLVEMSSVKGETLSELRRIVGKKAGLLSIHPLFGPALESRKGMKIAVIVRKKGEGEETATARRLFPEARIIPMGRKEHDRTMAVVLSLTHMLNLVYAGTVAQLLSPEEFRKVSTPNSSMQLSLAEAVLSQDARLSYAIQATNPYSRKVGRAASRELRQVLSMVEGADWESFQERYSKLSKKYRVEERSGAAMREVYSAAEKGA